MQKQHFKARIKKPPQRSIAEILDAYRHYLLSKVSKVRILGEADERELKQVFVELSVVDQRVPQQHAEFLGMIDSAMRRRLNPFADEALDLMLGIWERREEETKRRVKPDELLRRGTKAIATGAPGCGKTTLLKYLALQAQEKDGRLAVWLELKAIDRSLIVKAEKAAASAGNLILQELWLKHTKAQLSLSDAEVKILRDHWQNKFNVNEISVLLDGFDELQDEAIERSLNKFVREFTSGAHDNTLLISTRPYAQHKLGNEHLQELEIEPLTQPQIEAFLNCYYPNDTAVKSFLQALRERSSLEELLHLPLLLGVILRLHRENKYTSSRTNLYETIISDLVHKLDRSKSIVRHFKIDDGRLRLDFLKSLAFDRLLRDPLDREEQDANRIAFSYNLLKEKAEAFLIQERLPHHARDLADDVLATPLLREVSADTFAFPHLTLQEYLAANAFAAFYRCNEFEGLRIFCRAYHKPTIVELEVLPMMLGELSDANKLYAEIECWPESLTFANFRLRLRGLVYDARVSDERLSKTVDRVLDFLAESASAESTYRVPLARSLAGIDGHYAQTIINHIVSLLEGENYHQRFPAMSMLKRIGRSVRIRSDKASNALIKLLSDEDQFVRSEAAYTLGNFGSQKAVNALIRVLNSDDESFVRGSAAESLGQIGDEQSFSHLIEAFGNIEPGYRWHLVNALVAIGNEQIVDYLIEALKDENRDVRLQAAETLGRIGNEKAVDPLIEALKEGGYIPFHAAEALIRIGKEKAVDATVKALNSESKEVRRHIAEVLGKSGNERAVDALVEALISEDQYAAYRSAEILVRIGNEKAVDAMTKALSSKDGDIRKRAARALGLLRNEKAVDPLIAALSDENKDVRKDALEALCIVGNERAVDHLIAALEVTDGYAKQQIIMRLARIGNDKAVDALVAALNDLDGDVKDRAARELAGLGNEKGLDILIEVLREAHSRMSMKHSRLTVEDVLGQIGSEKALDALIDALDSEEFTARSGSARALGQIRNERAICALIKALGSKDTSVQLEAARALGFFDGTDLAKALKKSLRSEDSFARRKAAQTVGYYSFEPLVLEELARVAATDPVEETRIVAAEAKEQFARKLQQFDSFITASTAHHLSDNESRELFLVGEVFKVVAEAGHIFRPTPNSDWGVDGEIEFKNERGEASGRRVYLQLKSGDSHLRTRKSDGKEIFTIKNPRHLEYWQSHAYPVLLVIRDSREQIRWMNVTEYLHCQGSDTNQIDFRGEPFTAESVKQMRTRLFR